MLLLAHLKSATWYDISMVCWCWQVI